ncbi:unnamed protein product, partial [Ectocarpus sp. 6 AP-2014]
LGFRVQPLGHHLRQPAGLRRHRRRSPDARPPLDVLPLRLLPRLAVRRLLVGLTATAAIVHLTPRRSFRLTRLPAELGRAAHVHHLLPRRASAATAAAAAFP